MAVSNLKSLIAKLNETCRNALESAAGLCLSQTHYEVEVEHFLIKLLEMSDTDILKILKHFEINELRIGGSLRVGRLKHQLVSPGLVKQGLKMEGSRAVAVIS